MAQNHYQALQVFPGSSMEEIRKAYRRLAMKLHPDKNPENIAAAQQFLKVKEAYDLLSDPVRRKEYDRKNGFSYNPNALRPTVASILVETVALRKYVQSLNLHSLDHSALAYHLKKLLTSQRIDILLQDADEKTLTLIRDEIIQASTPLRYELVEETMRPLSNLLETKPALLQPVLDYKNARRQSRRLQQLVPWLVIVLTLLLCYGIFRANS